MYSTSLFSPVSKRLVTITCSIQTPGGIVAKKPQHAQNNQRSQQGKQGQQQKRGSKAQARAPRTPRQHPPAPGARAATSSSPSPRRHEWHAAGAVRLCLHLRRRLRGPPQLWYGHHQPACSTRTATKWVSSASPTGPTPPASRCLASHAWAFSSAPATWTPWSTTIR